MASYEACASASDANGNLLFYTNSVTIWNRNHQLMVNGQNIGGHESASQGATIVRNPANSMQYYVFVVDGCDNNLVGGLKYSLVDMSRQSGAGEVISRRVQVSTTSLTEKLTAIAHANGRDTWILVHGWQNDQFQAFLVTPTGVSLIPGVSSIGSVHSGGGGALGNANGVGYMKASPDGRKLALGIRDSRFELFDFNPSTGSVSNYIPLPQFYHSYGVEFSPDGSRLYGGNLDGNKIYQFNLLAGSAGSIAASAVEVANASNLTGALQLGPDGRIYVSLFGSGSLGVINTPNALGTACGFQPNGVSLGGRAGQLGLPNFPNRFAQPTVTAAITVAPVCVGAAVFSVALSPVVPTATVA
ncbi:MAG TPA: hypothetical protein VK364_00465 [Hymenobacter sp.]|nr:hypothetical protein [Hymenobacter sp.]